MQKIKQRPTQFLGIGAGIGPAPASDAEISSNWDKAFRTAAATRGHVGSVPGVSRTGAPGEVNIRKPVGFRIGRGSVTQPTSKAIAAYFEEALKAANPGRRR